MGGLDGSRGYLVQSVIALLNSLGDDTWNTVLIEPDGASQKVDILWEGTKGKKAVQVKSSINQITKADAKKWAGELRSDTIADEYALVLVGPCAQSVVQMQSFQGVFLPQPKTLDIAGLLSEAAHLLARFLEGKGLDHHSSTQREIMVSALTTQLFSLSTRGTPLSRAEFVATLKRWIGAMTAPASNWELVSFEPQRGIDNAVAGQRLGPADVDACPEFKICDDILDALSRSHFFELVGMPGCGKSITGWHVARKFHRSGFTVWRPKASANPDELLSSIPRHERTFIFLDDAQRFGKLFVDRLAESAGADIKILLASTIEDAMQASKICISPEHCVQELANALLPRRNELLPIIQKYDNWIGDRWGDVSLEDRIQHARRQRKPWEFFWILRGGWQTARREFTILRQFPNATDVLLLAAIGQIASCDAGVEDEWILQHAERMRINRKEVERASAKLRDLGLLLGDEPIRTKHITFANQIIEECFASAHYQSWKQHIELLHDCLLDVEWSLQGVSWALDVIGRTDAFRWDCHKIFIPLLEPMMQRCTREREDFDWASGCFSRLISCFELGTDEILKYRDCILGWTTSRCGLVSHFCGSIFNYLINQSSRTCDNVARDVIDSIDGVRLAEVANTVSVNELHTFGRLLDRVAFYKPSWADGFVGRFDWPRARQLILNADTEMAFGVDAFVTGIALMTRKDHLGGNLRFVEEIIPYIVRAINDHPCDAIEQMDGVFWGCLGYTPKLFRGGWAPERDQIRLAGNIVSALDPQSFAQAMESAIPRELETLARGLDIIHEIAPSFTARIANTLSEDRFFAATLNEWQQQSPELQHLIPFFCLDENAEPAARWVRENQHHIAGPLCPLFVCIAPDLAIEYHRAGKPIDIVHEHWTRTSFAIRRLARIDTEACVEIVERHFPKLLQAMYSLTLDPPVDMLRFFRVLFELSQNQFEKFVNMLSLDDPRALETIRQLLQNQHKEREHYTKLAKCGRQLSGRIAAISAELHRRLSPRTSAS